jgi:hypothetical protein
MALTSQQKKLFKKMFWIEQWWGSPSYQLSETVNSLSDDDILIEENKYKIQRISIIDSKTEKYALEKIDLGG